MSSPLHADRCVVYAAGTTPVPDASTVQRPQSTLHPHGGLMPQATTVTRDAGIASVVLTRPDSYNAFDLAAIEEIANALVTLGADDAVRAVVITGAGRAFCAGGDLKWAVSFGAGA